MSFLPLAAARVGDDHGTVNLMAVEQLVQDHQRDLARLAEAEHLARQARRAAGVGRGRRAVGAALVWLGMGVGLPRGRRQSALGHAHSLMIDDGRDQGLNCTAST